MIRDLLRKIPLFEPLDEATLDGVASLFRSRVFRAGEFIIQQDEDSDYVMVLFSGMARVRIFSAQGRELVIHDLRHGEVFGDWSAIDGGKRSASVVASTDSVVGMIPSQTYVDLITQDPVLARRQMTLLTGQLRAMNTKFSQYLLLKANLRIQSLLLQMARPGAEGMFIETLPPQPELALRAYTQREVVARELSRLQALGQLKREGESYWLIDADQWDVLKSQS